MAIQTNYDRSPAEGAPGSIARPNLPHWIEVGVSQVDSNERVPRPGDAVIRDNASGVNGFKVPGTGEFANTVGIVTYQDGMVPADNVVGTSTAIQYPDGGPIYVATFGVVNVRVVTGGSESITYGDLMQWDAPSAITGDADWEELSIAALASNADLAAVHTYLRAQPRIDIVAVNVDPVGPNTTAIIPVKVNMGR